MRYLVKSSLLILSSCLFMVTPSFSWAGGGFWYENYLAAARMYAEVARLFGRHPAEPPVVPNEESSNEEESSAPPTRVGTPLEDWVEISATGTGSNGSSSSFEELSPSEQGTPRVREELPPIQVPHLNLLSATRDPLPDGFSEGILHLDKTYTYLYRDGFICVLDTNTGNIVNTIEIEAAPIHVEVVGEILYVVTPHYIYVINTRNGELVEVQHELPPPSENAQIGGILFFPPEEEAVAGENPCNEAPVVAEPPREDLMPKGQEIALMIVPLLFANNTPSPQDPIVEPLEKSLELTPELSAPSLKIVPLSSPPSFQVAAKGKQIKNAFLSKKELTNILHWSAPDIETPPVRYKIYRNKTLSDLAASLPAKKTMHFEDHNRKKHATYDYYLVAVMENGQEIVVNHLRIP